MRATKVQAFILFTLGTCYAECSKRFAGKPLAVSMNKVAFIELARKAQITSKKERALYKNLEALEALRLITYENKNLALTPKGNKLFERIRTELDPYINVKGVLTSDDALKYTTRAQTILKCRQSEDCRASSPTSLARGE
jgi:hypothetical protein